ncbi:tRNA1(Val) (adenine(37)-N6)-methyltransferase [Sulfitobacter sp. THAF37]|uniref:tRNA1(Val) (adenine(37)-N6)-methyltransferase n=1 Tax=Sulfitobacter sp. THAF37 TaxID=2587855 RepID=UPI001267DDFD|nr:methyltransferase domain-containing protein [Sulfitobacter sp. THAF37]QFT57515.1 tRNA1(Val) (adenine(37)-N6)-methyltransferase [Sulfitobacter sp. THAF37]
MTPADDNDLTRDAFLGGRLHLWQPRQGYRAGVDAVLLAASIPATSGQRVLELGCGAGTAIMCLNSRVSGLHLAAVELQADMAELARCNGGDALEVFTADVADLPVALRQRQFDHVLANPPYYDRGASVRSDHAAREAAHGESTPLATWVKVAAKRLAPKGQAHFIQRIERLPDLIRALPGDLGSVEVLPLAAREGRAPERVILRARKNGRGAFRLHPALALHAGAQHSEANKDYVPAVQAALRNGAALRF